MNLVLRDTSKHFFCFIPQIDSFCTVCVTSHIWYFTKECIFLPAGCAKWIPAGIVLSYWPIFWFFAPKGDTLHRSWWNLAGRSGPVRSSLPNFTLIGSGVWVYGPKTLKIWNFTNIIAPNGRTPCAVLTKFICFMRALGLHNSAKFGWFISISDKTLNNLPRFYF